MSEIVSVYTTFPDEEEARRVGRALVEERLAACVNILGPCHSIYRWKGEIEEASEVAAILKTGADKAAALIARLTALHSYAVPAAVVWPADTAQSAYAEWVVDSIG
jgi:periplasmic divalent cation tolerance protein